jgi:molybdopterin-guanine dinucleotide biosynthesis protein A
VTGTVAAAIVAGGKAQRLGGQPKGLLEVGGRRIIDRQVEMLAAVFPRVLLVANDAAPWAGLAVTVVPDRVAGAGPLAGIDAALGALSPDEEAVVCVAGDMPFLTPEALALVRDAAPGPAAVAARVGGRPEPLFARYGRGCAPPLAAALAAGRFTAAAFLEEIGAVYLDEPILRGVDPSLTFLENINTPADLARARSLQSPLPGPPGRGSG